MSDLEQLVDEICKRLCKSYEDKHFDHQQVDVDDSEQFVRIGRRRYLYRQVMLTTYGDSDYFDHRSFNEALWWDVCARMDWKGMKADLPFRLFPRSYMLPEEMLAEAAPLHGQIHVFAHIDDALTLTFIVPMPAKRKPGKKAE